MIKKASSHFLSSFKIDALFIGIIILISITLILPYFKPGYFPTHDGEWAVVRLSEMFREVRDLQFPPRYSNVLNNGYGYPLFNFAYPFPYYAALVFKFAGLGFVASTKAVFVLSVLFSGIGMYVLARNVWKSQIGGLVSAILYLFLPYRMVDLYVRGSIGESLAFAILPFLMFCIIAAKKYQEFKYIYLSVGSILLGSLILTHNIMAVYYVPLLLLFGVLLILQNGKKLLGLYIPMLIFGVGMSSFFWFPALLEKKKILLSAIPIADRSLYFVSVKDLVIPSWGYGIPTDAANGFSYQLGIGVIASLLVALVYLIGLLLKKIKFDNESIIAGAFLVVSILMVIFMFSSTLVFWKLLPFLNEINYPWTLLAPIGFIGAFLSGFLVSRGRAFVYLFAAVLLISGFFVLQYAKPESYVNRGDGYYSTNEATTTSSKELMPLWVKEIPNSRPQQKVEIVEGKGSINEIIGVQSNKVSFDAQLVEPGIIRINTVFYPGWKIFVNDAMTNFSYDNQFGVMELPLDAGNYSVEAKFVETKPRLIVDLISLASFAAASGIFLFGVYQLFNINHGKTKK